MDFQDVIELVEADATVVIQRAGKPDIVMTSGQRNPDQIRLTLTSGQRNPDFQPVAKEDELVISRVRQRAGLDR